MAPRDIPPSGISAQWKKYMTSSGTFCSRSDFVKAKDDLYAPGDLVHAFISAQARLMLSEG
jgi:hypothetical protein